MTSEGVVKVRLACSTQSFPQDRLPIAIAKVGWAGYPGVELALDTEPLPDTDELRERLRANELMTAAVFAGTLPVGPTEAILDELGRIGRAAALARALDGSVLVVEAPSEGNSEGIAASLRLLDVALGDTNADICVVNRMGTILADRTALQELWKQELPARVGLALDPAHAQLAGWDPLALDELPVLPRHMYVNDVLGGKVVPAGEGELDLEGMMGELRRRGYDGSLVVLLENADAWAVEPIAKETRELVSMWLDEE